MVGSSFLMNIASANKNAVQKITCIKRLVYRTYTMQFGMPSHSKFIINLAILKIRITALQGNTNSRRTKVPLPPATGSKYCH